MAPRRPRLRQAIPAGLALALVAACTGGASPSPLPVPSGALVVHVQNTAFQPADPSVTSGQGITLYFDNEDAIPHNLVFLAQDGTRVFAGDVITGPTQRVYQVPTLASGTYKLHCDIHPEMKGTLTVP